ncbi:MAG: DUF4831 family protein [Bacteroidota bacterium]|nr:DUF4831 family protein [Bacteroidota bacterium]
MTIRHIIYCIKILVIVFSLTNCTNTSKLKVKKIDKTKQYSDEGIIYSLPLTVLQFNFEIIAETVIPGPYCIYAEKYLGIKNAAIKHHVKWAINKVDVQSYKEIDPSEFYIFDPVGQFNIDIEKLSNKGFILPINKRDYNKYKTNNKILYRENKDVLYKDLSSKKYVGYETKTYYKRVKRDSLYAKIPVTETNIVKKSLKDKAEEAAELIMTIRERRIELLTGYGDFSPNGASLDANLKELKRIEDEYVSLFVGKKTVKKYNVSYGYTPKNTDLDKDIKLFRFSEDKGVLEDDNPNGEAIKISLNKFGVGKEIKNLFADKINRVGEEYENKLFYRIPDIANVIIKNGVKEIANSKLEIEQFGVVVAFPSKFLTKKEKFIEFYKKKR